MSENTKDDYLDYMPEGDGRGVALGDVPNARGIGGYPTTDGHTVRSGLFFRSAGLNFLGDNGLEDLRALGVKEVVDLRDPAEVKLWPYELPEDITVENIPLIKRDTEALDADALQSSDPATAQRAVGDISMEAMYHDIAFKSGEEIVSILKRLLEENGRPMLIHCTAGKDRTGITSGVLMSLLGVSDDMVVSCYARSGANLGEAFKKTVMGGLAQDESGAAEVDAAQTAVLASPPELMRGLLGELHEAYGTVEEYCLQHGMAQSEVDGLKDLFLQ